MVKKNGMATEVSFEFENEFNAQKYEQLSSNPELASLVKAKVENMLAFMKKMNGGVQHMRSNVVFSGVTYKFSLKLVK